ncbi:MAG: Pyruvate kinase [Acetothermia bacterium 64_32]|nr:MAG: Pyruvate kinase [Acetothermia bacterium 64_32]HAF71157.1 pyruvate kinase [Candidatus Acetothermia bacterium]
MDLPKALPFVHDKSLSPTHPGRNWRPEAGQAILLGMKRTKIVATLGPSSSAPDVIAAMAEAGMDVARINASHGTAVEHEVWAGRVREVARALGRPLGLMLDTRGPEVRVGELPQPISLSPGEEVLLGERGIPVNYGGLVEDVPVGAEVFLADGSILLRVTGKERGALRCRVERGGRLGPGKRVSVPGVRLALPPLPPADRESLRLARELSFEFVALSFVQGPEDVEAARQELGPGPWLVAKVETQAAVQDMARIVAAADGAMVARGDLGVEVDLFRVPLVQRRLVDLCNSHAKPVVVATQMLESMVNSPVPTRAEVADVAAAVWDGADGVMLSEETAVGRYPVEAVRAMACASRAAESGEVEIRVPGLVPELVGQVPAAIARAACQIAEEIRAAAIVCATFSGWTARLLSSFRSKVPIVATTPVEETVRRLTLVWGVIPLKIDRQDTPDALAAAAVATAKGEGLISPGDRVVFTAGLPFWQAGTTNLVRVLEVS